MSIGTGLLLSILYYAIPVEPPASPGTRKRRFTTFLRKQLKFERVAITLPALRNKKLVFVGTPLLAAIVGYSANLFLLQEPVNDILHRNSAFNGMDISAHYEYWIVPGVVVSVSNARCQSPGFEPSRSAPYMPTTRSFGRCGARPSPIDDASPIACCR